MFFVFGLLVVGAHGTGLVTRSAALAFGFLAFGADRAGFRARSTALAGGLFRIAGATCTGRLTRSAA